MITSNDYLKSITKMNEQEKEIYFARVKKWTEEDYPRLCAVQEAWTANDFKSFDEGCILISALMAARAWLPEKIYRKDINRRLTWVRDWLAEINKRYGNVDFGRVDTAQREELGQRAIFAATPKGVQPTTLHGTAAAHARAAEAAGKIPAAPTPRPKHLDAYVHLLSKELQEAVATLSSMYLKQGEFSQMLQKLADDPRSNPADRERYAKALSKVSDAIYAIYARAEAEWEALPETEKAKVGVVAAQPAESKAEKKAEGPAPDGAGTAADAENEGEKKAEEPTPDGAGTAAEAENEGEKKAEAEGEKKAEAKAEKKAGAEAENEKKKAEKKASKKATNKKRTVKKEKE